MDCMAAWSCRTHQHSTAHTHTHQHTSPKVVRDRLHGRLGLQDTPCNARRRTRTPPASRHTLLFSKARLLQKRLQQVGQATRASGGPLSKKAGIGKAASGTHKPFGSAVCCCQAGSSARARHCRADREWCHHRQPTTWKSSTCRSSHGLLCMGVAFCRLLQITPQNESTQKHTTPHHTTTSPSLTAAPAMRLNAAPLRPKRPLRPMRCR